MGRIADIIDAAPADRKPTGGVPCRLSLYLAAMEDDTDRDTVLGLVHDVSRSRRQISDILAGAGLQVDPGSIGRHQARTCRTCYPVGANG